MNEDKSSEKGQYVWDPKRRGFERSVAEFYVNGGGFCKFDIIEKKCAEILPYARTSGRWAHREWIVYNPFPLAGKTGTYKIWGCEKCSHIERIWEGSYRKWASDCNLGIESWEDFNKGRGRQMWGEVRWGKVCWELKQDRQLTRSLGRSSLCVNVARLWSQLLNQTLI